MKLLEYFHKLSIYPKNAKELKGLILQLAVQGQLTADWRLANPDVESATVLLERIKAEKEALIKAKKVRKEKALPVINKDEISFKLPDNWVLCQLGEIVRIKGGKRIPKGDSLIASPTKHIYIRVTDMKKGTVLLDRLKYITEDVYEKIKNYTISKNDLYITIAGTIGDVGEIPEALDNMNLTENAAKIIFKQLNKPFLKIMLNSNICQRQFLGKVNQMAQPKLALKRIQTTLIFLPPLQEQEAIVKVVNTLLQEVNQLEQLTQQRLQLKEKYVTAALNQVCEENTAKVWTDIKGQFSTFFNEEGNIKKLRETILQLAVQGKLTANWRAANPDVEPAAVLLERIKVEKQELIKTKKIKKEKPLPAIDVDEVPYTLPDGWIWCRLTDLVNVGTGSTPMKSNSSYYGGTTPWYTSSATNNLIAKTPMVNITEKALKETNCKIFPVGSLIIAMYGQGKTRGQISELVVAGATNQAIAAMVFYENSKEIKGYLKAYFQKIYQEIRTLAEGGAQPNLNVGKIKNTFIPLPSKQEIPVIMEKVNELMMFCDNLEKEVTKSKETAEALMQVVLKEVFDGKEVETV